MPFLLISFSSLGVIDLFFDFLKVVVVVSSYLIADQLVEPKGYMPEDRHHTPMDRFMVYMKALGGCIIASFLINNLIIPYTGFKSNYLEAFALMFIPIIIGINTAYRKKKIHIKRPIKKLLLVLPLMFYCSLSQGQTMQLKAVQFVCTRFENEKLDPPEFKDLKNVLVEFDMDSSILTIHSSGIQIFRLTRKPIFYSDSDSSITTKFSGIDNKGDHCIVTAVLYKSEHASHIACFTLEYPDKVYIYYTDIS